MSWYRCRARVGDGEYVSYIGPSMEQALESMAKHDFAQEVSTEVMDGVTDWGAVQWKQISTVVRR